VIEGTGQSGLPAIELEDGSWYRKESADMVREIRAGKFGSPEQPAAEPTPNPGLST
jgi:hypothetical protein